MSVSHSYTNDESSMSSYQLIWNGLHGDHFTLPSTMDGYSQFVKFINEKCSTFHSTNTRYYDGDSRFRLDEDSKSLKDCAEDLFKKFGGKRLVRIDWFTGAQRAIWPGYSILYLYVVNEDASVSKLSFSICKAGNERYNSKHHFKPVRINYQSPAGAEPDERLTEYLEDDSNPDSAIPVENTEMFKLMLNEASPSFIAMTSTASVAEAHGVECLDKIIQRFQQEHPGGRIKKMTEIINGGEIWLPRISIEFTSGSTIDLEPQAMPRGTTTGEIPDGRHSVSMLMREWSPRGL